MSKKSKVERPNRDPDYYSKRSVPYWWAPEWVRGTSREAIFEDSNPRTNATQQQLILLSDGRLVLPCCNYGKIHPVKEANGNVHLYMRNKKDGKLTFIQGSIQREFHQWHEDRQIDYILLGMDLDDIIKDESDEA